MDYLAILLAFSPLVWELHNDSNGDAHVTRAKLFEPVQMLSKRLDIYARLLIAVIAAAAADVALGVPLSRTLVLAAALHFAFFDYAIAFILIRKGIITGHWFTHLGSKGFDNWKPWRSLSPWARLGVRVVVLVLAIWIYRI